MIFEKIWNCSRLSGNFQTVKNVFGQFIRNCPPKHVITSTNWQVLLQIISRVSTPNVEIKEGSIKQVSQWREKIAQSSSKLTESDSRTFWKNWGLQSEHWERFLLDLRFLLPLPHYCKKSLLLHFFLFTIRYFKKKQTNMSDIIHWCHK